MLGDDGAIGQWVGVRHGFSLRFVCLLGGFVWFAWRRKACVCYGFGIVEKRQDQTERSEGIPIFDTPQRTSVRVWVSNPLETILHEDAKHLNAF